MRIRSTEWWETDVYDVEAAIPPQLKELAPYGPALVSVYNNGSTQPGWGGHDKGSGTFMENFRAGNFSHRTKVYQCEKNGKPFAFVMRSFRALVVDIDGKNNGLMHVGKLGLLPPTLAEESKSGNGYHLFYSLNDEWDEDEGFALLPDFVGIVEGVDIRATGCVYHHAHQRWNGRDIVPAPDHLVQRLTERVQSRRAATNQIIKIATEGDEMDIAMLHRELENDLAKPIQPGGRNNTLFAIGSKMLTAGHPDWDTLIRNRAEEVDLDVNETDKLISNISKYGAAQATP